MGSDSGNKAGGAKADREAKLAQALRDNLRRRKASGARPPAKPPDEAESS